MKCARQYGENTQKDIIISFFFNARGGDLERSAEGMYRFLLYQLLEGITGLVPSLGNTIDIPRLPCKVDNRLEGEHFETLLAATFWNGIL